MVKMVGKRDLSIFDAIEELETEDRRADGKRRKKTQTDARRAVEVQHQTKIYHHLVESRILLQRAMKSQHTIEKLNEFKNATTNSSSTSSSSSSSSSSFRDTCSTLLETLLHARCSLWKQRNGIQTEDLSTKYHDIVNSSSNVRLNETLQKEYDEHREGWKDVLNSRHKSLRLHSGVTAKSQFKVMDSSFWQQVEASMEYEEIRDKDRKSDTKFDANNEDFGVTVDFDDSKLYQQFLKDFVASSTSAAIGGTAAAAERLRKSRNKNADKKDVDRRASKGRKIRYKEIPKLVNFTFPLSRPNTSHLDQDAYFQSLFGGVAAQGRGR